MRLDQWAILVASAGLVGLTSSGCASRGEAPRAWAPDDIPEAYASSVGALMWASGTRAYQVTPEGHLFNGAWHVRIEGAADESLAAPPRTIASEDRWLPVLRWTRRTHGVRWDFEAVACPEPEPGPLSDRGLLPRLAGARDRASDRRAIDARFAAVPLERADRWLERARRPIERDPIDRRNVLVSLQITVTNETPQGRDVRTDLSFDPMRPEDAYREPDSLLGVHWDACWGGDGERDSVMGHGSGDIAGRTLTSRFALGAGDRRTLRVALPVYPVPHGTLESWARVPHARRVEEVRAFWLAEMARGADFEIPDAEVTRAWRAANVLLLSLRERRLTSWVPIGGPFHYRDVWLRDGARALHALAIAGYTRESRQLAASFLEFQWPHGPFRSQGGQLDGTGQAMWALEQAMLRPAPAADVQRYAAAAARAWRSLERDRRSTPKIRGVSAGLLPVTDPHDAELVEAQLVGNDAWAIAGYRSCARLLHAAGEHALADSVTAALEDYRRAFLGALASVDRTDIAPSWQGAGTDWGNLAVGYPCRALPAGEPRLLALARRYWAPLGNTKLGYYRDPDAAHTYVAADLGTWAMLAGQRAMADSVLDACLAWRSASGGAAEIFSLSRRDFGVNYPPHPTSAAAIVALVRNGLVFDDADTLQLTLGARASWWRGTRVRRAPTRFGRIDLAFSRHGGEARWTWTPVAVWSAVTLPPGSRLAGILPRGCRAGERPDVVLVPPGRGELVLTVADDEAS